MALRHRVPGGTRLTGGGEEEGWGSGEIVEEVEEVEEGEQEDFEEYEEEGGRLYSKVWGVGEGGDS